MANNLTEAQINEIVARVVSEFKAGASAPKSDKAWDSTQYHGRKLIGVYETMEEAIDAANAGYNIKLIGLIEDTGDGLVATVCPRLVPVSNPLASVNDVNNAILVTCDALGDALFIGKGAGKFPTASAVVGDIVDAVKHQNADICSLTWQPSNDNSFIKHYKQDKVRVYVRIQATNADDLKNYITNLFGFVDFIPRKYRSSDELAFITPDIVETEIDKSLALLAEKATVKKKIRLL